MSWLSVTRRPRPGSAHAGADDRAETPPTPPTTPERTHGRSFLLIIASVSMIGPFSIDVYLPAMPDMASNLGSSHATIQLSITTFMIGMAMGQVIIGPMSDAFGRRRPLLVGLCAYTVCSLACALAPSAPTLAAIRLLQGLAASAGVVISLATVRDMYSGREAARFLSLVRTVSGVGPLAAPVVGAQVLRLTDWRGVFGVQVVFGLLLVIGVSRLLPETHPQQLRQPPKIRRAVQSLGTVGRDLGFLSFTLPAALMSGAAFSYISGSSFVFQDGYGLSAQVFSLIFALNVISMVLAALVNSRLVSVVEPRRLFAIALSILVGGPLLLLITVYGTNIGVAGVVITLSICLIGFGLGNPNAMSLAIDAHPTAAGSAAGLYGIMGFATGAIAAPLSGLTHASSGSGLGIQMLLWSGAAALLYLILRRRVRSTQPVNAG